MSEEVEEKGAGPVKKAGIGCAVVLVALIAIGMFADPPSPEEVAAREKAEAAEKQAEAQSKIAGAEKVTAQQLFNAYQQNEVAAKQALDGRSVLITGTIDDITLDFMDDPVVSLVTSNQFMSVQVGFEKDVAQAVSGLSKGQEFTALCDKVSEVAGTPMLNDCVIPEASAE